MVLAVNRAVAGGARAVVCASTGNTSASAAAYAAAAGLPCHVILPAGKVARGKLAQALAAGARLTMVDGNFDAALTRSAGWARKGWRSSSTRSTRIGSRGSRRPRGRSSTTSAARPMRWRCRSATPATSPPTGRGFRRYADEGRATSLPRMLGFQAEGAAPIVRGAPVESPETVATAIRIGNPASWEGAVAARDESGGLIEAVSDDEILEAQRLIAQLEGVFCEPASAAGVAGVRRLAAEGRIGQEETVVCVLTGHGLKDPDAVQAEEGSLTPIPPELDAIRAAMGL